MYTFFVYYCHAEGLTLSMSLTRSVMLYIFYGKYVQEFKKKGVVVKRMTRTVLYGIHSKITCNRSRFAKNVETNFATLIALLNQKPEYKKFLDDKGKGQAPVEYLAAVETGFRLYSRDKYCMGVNGGRSRTQWGQIPNWRKREAYIVFVRFFLHNKVTYKKWTCFVWTDFMMRYILEITFRTRHAPLSDGKDHFDGLAWKPEGWNTGDTSPPSSPNVSAPAPPAPAAASDTEIVPMRFSPTKGKLVPYE